MGDDEDKILFVLSHLKGSAADKYKQNWLDAQRDSDTNEILINNFFCLFMRELDRAFTPVNKHEDAQKHLKDLVQGSQTAKKFFQKFKLEQCSTRYTDFQFDSYLISLLRQALCFSTVTKIVG